VPVAHPTGWATSTEYYIRNSGYKAANVGTTIVSCPLNLSTILPHQHLASFEHSDHYQESLALSYQCTDVLVKEFYFFDGEIKIYVTKR
jgi:hypothetical protein